jgi:hypothetical protein
MEQALNIEVGHLSKSQINSLELGMNKSDKTFNGAPSFEIKSDFANDFFRPQSKDLNIKHPGVQ